jgi:hypothetical protein
VPEKALAQFPGPRSTTAVSVFKVLVPPPKTGSLESYEFVMTAQFV